MVILFGSPVTQAKHLGAHPGYPKTNRPQPEGFLNGQEVPLAVFFSTSLCVFMMALLFTKAAECVMWSSNGQG